MRSIIYTHALNAVKHGWGSAQYRSVSGLTASEKAAVLSGGVVYFGICNTHWTQSGWKVVTSYSDSAGRSRFDSREPTAGELAEIKLLEDSVNRTDLGLQSSQD